MTVTDFPEPGAAVPPPAAPVPSDPPGHRGARSEAARAPDPARVPVPDAALVRSEIVKIVRRRGLAITTVLLTVGIVIVAFTVMAILHAANPFVHDPAGGRRHFIILAGHVLPLFGIVAATLVGATAGAGDLASGVFRMLVATGRPRGVLFAARVPGGLAVLLPLAVVTYALVCVLTFVLAGGQPVPQSGTMVQVGLWYLLFVTMQYLLALGVASAVGSRSTTIPLVIAFNVVLTPLVEALTGFAWFRQLFLDVALDQLAPQRFGFLERLQSHLSMSTGTAVVVVVGWAAASLGLGAWRTVTRDA